MTRPPSTNDRMAKADFLTGLVIFVLGIYMVFEGLRMPGAGGFIEAGGEPGRVPALLGCILAVLALVLLFRAVTRGGHRGWRVKDPDRDIRLGALRSALTALICSLYALGLLGSNVLGWQIAYHEATFAFLFLFISGFEWQHAPDSGARAWARVVRRAPAAAGVIRARLHFIPLSFAPHLWLLAVAALQAAAITAAVTYLFEQQFYVRLP